MNKEVNDALHTLLSIALENNKYESQKEQYKIVYDYIMELQEENKEAHDFDETMKDIKENLIARIQRQECEIERLHNIISRTRRYVQSLCDSGRGCDIYADIKKEILNNLKDSDKE